MQETSGREVQSKRKEVWEDVAPTSKRGAEETLLPPTVETPLPHSPPRCSVVSASRKQDPSEARDQRSPWMWAPRAQS